ncbi:MAG TPA: FMN-binding glutamate synthase family protein [Acetobacteraceae bacterium]|nr:FMN-binding glutamate synthase family protein [Acetobacteraceae bacterium]
MDLTLPFTRRYITLTVAVVVAALTAPVAGREPGALVVMLVALLLVALGIHDLLQKRHAILRNYPIAGHIRFLLEDIRVEIRQYFLESDTDGAPFDRNSRSIVYARAKGQLDKRPFGTELDMYAGEFEWLNHSIAPAPVPEDDLRITIGGADCRHPYDTSILNISAMSFGALSANAIRALNAGAKLGNFAHDTGEGGFSPYHRENGGDIIWEVGSGYFGCRDQAGHFDAAKFAAQAQEDQVRMVEVKLSQGAKPGHGGVLPAAKVSEEIARTRGVRMGEDCISPARHSAFSTPTGLLEFVARFRELSGGKPAGFKLCVGHPWEFLGICKAMLATGITPDFIVIDGAEGGTGAAPLEFADHIGMPLRDGLMFAHNALVGVGLRDRIRLGASGKIISAFDIARTIALGADWCNAGRGFMFAVGCIQSQSCHTDRCPTGVATQDPVRQRALDVPSKSERVARFHHNTVRALAEVLAAAGLSHPDGLRPLHFSKRLGPARVERFDQVYRFLAPGELLAGTDDPRFRDAWRLARAESFAAAA